MILIFYAFTGYDVISTFRGKGKKSAWQTSDVCDEASGVFIELSQYQSVVDDENLETFEKFGIMKYDGSSTAEGVGDAKLDVFAIRNYSFNPSSGEALCEACFLQGGLHLESINITSTRNADSCQLELNQERKSVADRLKKICGRSFGQKFHRLRRVSRS